MHELNVLNGMKYARDIINRFTREEMITLYIKYSPGANYELAEIYIDILYQIIQSDPDMLADTLTIILFNDQQYNLITWYNCIRYMLKSDEHNSG